VTRIWYTPEELVQLGFARSPVVMLNEAHKGQQRCLRTRLVGRRVLPVAHAAGARFLALEALHPEVAEFANSSRSLPPVTAGYFAQAEMQALVHAALELGWTLIPYEANGLRYFDPEAARLQPARLSKKEATFLARHQRTLLSLSYTNWREQQQAENLIRAFVQLPRRSRMLVWCGNSHLYKQPLGRWQPMGYHFHRLSGIEAFAIDQTTTVQFSPLLGIVNALRLWPIAHVLGHHGGTAGYLLPSRRRSGVDALLLSLHNGME
jgi:hypothetical protein